MRVDYRVGFHQYRSEWVCFEHIGYARWRAEVWWRARSQDPAPTTARMCLSLFGDKADQHRFLAEHITAEYRVKTEGRGRTVDEWKLRPEASENHWLDCLVGCAVAASIQGAVLPGTDGKAVPRRQRN